MSHKSDKESYTNEPEMAGAICVLGCRVCTMRLNGESRLDRETYVRFCEWVMGADPLVDLPEGFSFIR